MKNTSKSAPRFRKKLHLLAKIRDAHLCFVHSTQCGVDKTSTPSGGGCRDKGKALWLVLQPTIRNNAQLPHLSRHSIASLYHPQPIFESVFWHCVEGQQHYNGMTPGVDGNGFVANVTSERACKRVDMRKQQRPYSRSLSSYNHIAHRGHSR